MNRDAGDAGLAGATGLAIDVAIEEDRTRDERAGWWHLAEQVVRTDAARRQRDAGDRVRRNEGAARRTVHGADRVRSLEVTRGLRFDQLVRCGNEVVEEEVAVRVRGLGDREDASHDRAGERDGDAREARLASIPNAVRVGIEVDRAADAAEHFPEVLVREPGRRERHVANRRGAHRAVRVVRRLNLDDAIVACRKVVERVVPVRVRGRAGDEVVGDRIAKFDRYAVESRLARLRRTVAVVVAEHGAADGLSAFAEVVAGAGLRRADVDPGHDIVGGVAAERARRIEAVRVRGRLRFGDPVNADREPAERVVPARIGGRGVRQPRCRIEDRVAERIDSRQRDDRSRDAGLGAVLNAVVAVVAVHGAREAARSRVAEVHVAAILIRPRRRDCRQRRLIRCEQGAVQIVGRDEAADGQRRDRDSILLRSPEHRQAGEQIQAVRTRGRRERDVVGGGREVAIRAGPDELHGRAGDAGLGRGLNAVAVLVDPDAVAEARVADVAEVHIGAGLAVRERRHCCVRARNSIEVEGRGEVPRQCRGNHIHAEGARRQVPKVVDSGRVPRGGRRRVVRIAEDSIRASPGEVEADAGQARLARHRPLKPVAVRVDPDAIAERARAPVTEVDVRTVRVRGQVPGPEVVVSSIRIDDVAHARRKRRHPDCCGVTHRRGAVRLEHGQPGELVEAIRIRDGRERLGQAVAVEIRRECDGDSREPFARREDAVAVQIEEHFVAEGTRPAVAEVLQKIDRRARVQRE